MTVSMAAGTFDISIAANMTFSICLLGALLTDGGRPVGARGDPDPCRRRVGGCGQRPAHLHASGSRRSSRRSACRRSSPRCRSGSQTARRSFSPTSAQTFTDLGTMSIATVPITVFYLAAVAVALWYLMEHTPIGRYLYAIGSNPRPQSSPASGWGACRWLSLIMTGALAALAGVILTMQLGAASFGAGAPYLLPAFAATFLGSTQILPGRFNVRGTIVALYLLAIAVKGLQLQFPDLPWIKDMVEGLVLLVAVSITTRAVRSRKT